MIKWGLYYILLLILSPVAWILPPFLVLLSKDTYGLIDNGNNTGVEPRLPKMFSWFQTPDNSLLGDNGHKQRWYGKSRYMQMLSWLWRNRLYGLRWSIMAAPIDRKSIVYDGNLDIKNRKNAVSGVLKIKMNEYWQYKRIVELPNNKCIQINLGWIIDPFIKDKHKSGKAIFTSSIRYSDFFKKK